ncbi:WD40/YVTN/BNR-like repeat-containing protein [Brevibacillus marinus]|uniref:WD40/YVTN/BNR-like repeat-containing protein n=1 Tax=Brevibacillus marinus TaxID=2496837 RepID=UPI000F8235D0|nr:hypothetical protein [Brevibacillus marinus]
MRAGFWKYIWATVGCLLLLPACSVQETAQRNTTSPPIQAAQIPGDLTYQDVLQTGGYVTAVGMSPSEPRIWLGTHSGLYLSAGGEMWALLSDELADDTISGWVIDPQRPQWVIVGTSKGCKQSKDGGKTWQSVGSGLPGGAELRLLTGGRTASRLQLFAYLGEEGIYHSDDGGGTWRKWMDVDQEVTAMLYVPQQQQLYVVTQDSLLRSSGGTWERAGIPDVRQIYSLAADPEERLYLATDEGVFYQAEDGWTPLAPQTPEKLIMLGTGWGEYRLVAVGESAFLYTLYNDQWQQWETS